MTTWNNVTQATTTYTSQLSDLFSGYVAVDYVLDDYILGSEAWSVVPTVSSVWAVA